MSAARRLTVTGYEVRSPHGSPILTRDTRKAAKAAAREWARQYPKHAPAKFLLVELSERTVDTFTTTKGS